MSHRQDDVRAVLDQVKADGRTALTAPECKTVCDAYGIPLPQEGLADSPAAAVAIADQIMEDWPWMWIATALFIAGLAYSYFKNKVD